MSSRIVFGLAALFVVAFTVWMGWYELHPQERGCAHSIALCKPKDLVAADKDCRDVLADIRVRLGLLQSRSTAQCMLDAQSCNESLSCMAHADRRALAK
jgi:hypothetical protein